MKNSINFGEEKKDSAEMTGCLPGSSSFYAYECFYAYDTLYINKDVKVWLIQPLQTVIQRGTKSC